MEFNKVLAPYYKKWAEDCEESARYCRERGNVAAAQQYEENEVEYRKLIAENEEAIEFFSQGDNAFILDSALPEKWRGYK